VGKKKKKKKVKKKPAALDSTPNDDTSVQILQPISYQGDPKPAQPQDDVKRVPSLDFDPNVANPEGSSQLGQEFKLDSDIDDDFNLDDAQVNENEKSTKRMRSLDLDSDFF